MDDKREQRSLVLAPSGKDSSLIAGALQRSGILAHVCASVEELVSEARLGVGAMLVAEEALVKLSLRRLMQELIEDQPSWSDLPVVLLAKAGLPTRLQLDLGRTLGNVTLLERPVPSATLVSAVRTALRTRERQYATRTADRRKDEFLATLAHELRNPLAPMTNALHLVKRGDATASVRDWSLAVMQRQLLQMTRLVDDLLDVARISQGKVVLQRRIVDAREVIRNAVEVSAPLIEAMRHTLVMTLPEEPARVDADPVRLAQCISNLLNNAAKYTPEGGRIEIDAECVGMNLRIAVEDDGLGIPPSAMEQLFHIFSQVGRSKDHSRGGLGIGLSIVKAFVELHGGTVWAASDGEGRGSTFTIHMPLVESCEDVSVALPGADTRREVQPHRILVVDDNIDSADSLSLLLTACGHKVSKAYTGQGGIEAARAHPPDLAILDIGLPDMSGFDLAARLREDEATAHTVLVALSGWGQKIDRQRSAQAGFAHHLVKPADPAAVLELIQSAAHTVPSP
ncbi:hybrid sensor histidine kinase/response regulator [Piscinibacter terrae]|uniref:histidine kinase n=1 Tax=Piscinibacter terrae TaxID=2496871 RepID=A0A3N7HPB6_9BURK|nr:ATP-binding protein [Albitalea terrae]RQP23994.1 hybrid sensor histidine kinase/response regulator [Albitalea terrae]